MGQPQLPQNRPGVGVPQLGHQAAAGLVCLPGCRSETGGCPDAGGA